MVFDSSEEEDMTACKNLKVPSAALDLILCGASESIFADALTEQFSDRRILRFGTEIEFTRWLFKQPRNATMLAPVLVADVREAKPCLDAMNAVRTGNIMSLRPDNHRPQLSEAAPGVEFSRAVAEMLIVAKTKNHKREARRARFAAE